MVTGSLPYLKEANKNDSLYQLIMWKEHKSYWKTWRRFRKPRKQSQDSKLPDEAMLLLES